MGRIEFGLDKSGRVSVVAKHVTEETVYYGDDWDEESEHRVTSKGRKVLSYEDRPKDSPFITLRTASLDGGDATRVSQTRIATLYRQELVHMRQVELDERTGRILIAAD